MLSVKLIEPTVDFKNEYISMIEEWQRTCEKMVPFVLRYDYEDFDRLLEQLEHLQKGIQLKENTVSSSTYWLINADREVVGAVNIRHRLNDRLRQIGGHIGYGIRPSRRKQGYATELLRQALVIAKGMNLEHALLTCDKDNIGSAKTIVKNGGILDSVEIVDGVEIQRYWIDTQPINRLDN